MSGNFPFAASHDFSKLFLVEAVTGSIRIASQEGPPLLAAPPGNKGEAGQFSGRYAGTCATALALAPARQHFHLHLHLHLRGGRCIVCRVQAPPALLPTQLCCRLPPDCLLCLSTRIQPPHPPATTCVPF